MKIISVGTVSDLVKADTLFWGSLMASAVLGSVPIAILYSFFVKQLRVRAHRRGREGIGRHRPAWVAPDTGGGSGQAPRRPPEAPA